MNTIEWPILIILAIALIVAGRNVIKRRRNGGCDGCDGCPPGDERQSCSREDENEKKK